LLVFSLLYKNMEEIDKDENTRIYEFGYLLVPTISEGNIKNEVSALKETLQKIGAIVVSDEYPRLIQLAYKMIKTISNNNERFLSAYFGWIKFELNPEELLSLKKNFDKNEKIIRFLLIKTVRENTLASKKSLSKIVPRKRKTVTTRKPEAKEPLEEINKEEVDKKIEELVLE